MYMKLTCTLLQLLKTDINSINYILASLYFIFFQFREQQTNVLTGVPMISFQPAHHKYIQHWSLTVLMNRTELTVVPAEQW